jgi:CHAT domain-containing protein/tetratricopeptide (TPR) repeat protein
MVGQRQDTVVIARRRGLAAALALLAGWAMPAMAQDTPPPTEDNVAAFEAQVAEMQARRDALDRAPQPDALALASVNEELAIAHHELGVALSRKGDVANATSHYRTAYALDLASYGAGDPVVLNSGNSLATNLNFLARYAEAEAILRTLLASAQSDTPQARTLRWTIVNTLAGSLTGQNRLTDAEGLLRETLLTMETRDDSQASQLYALITNNLAHNLHEQKRHAEAEPLFAKVVALNAAQGDQQGAAGLLARHNLAANRTSMGRLAEALADIQPVFATRAQMLGPDHPDTLTSQTIMGEALLGLDRTAESIAVLTQALAGRKRALPDGHPDRIMGQAALAKALLRDPSRASEAIDHALPAARAIRAKFDVSGFGTGDQSQFARDVEAAKALHRLMLEAAWHSSRADREALALEAAQALLNGTTSRAVATRAANRQASAAGIQGLIEQRQVLSEQWQRRDQDILSLVTRKGPDVAAAIQSAMAQRQVLEGQIAEVDARIRVAAPDYFSLIRPALLSTTQAMDLLRSDEAAMMILPREAATHVLLLRSGSLRWHRSEWTEARIDAAAARLLWDVGADVSVEASDAAQWEAEGQGVYPFAFETAHALYRELIAPVERELEGRRVLFISATGLLSNLPLGILVSAVPQGVSGAPETLRSAPWFANRIAQVYIPSLQSLGFLRQFRIEADDGEALPFIGFGDPLLEGKATTRGSRRGAGLRGTEQQVPPEGRTVIKIDQGTAKAMADPAVLRAMARLPGTATELTAIWDAFGKPDDTLFLGELATESRVRSTRLNARIISFATHGLLPQEIGGLAEPGLIFSPPSSPQASDDGYLTASEIAELRISSRWVVLSACNTAGSATRGGEGFSGLARAFFFAGAPTLLASHWPVRDDVAARLTVAAARLTYGPGALSPAEAMQRAMRAIRDDTSHDSETDTWAHPNAWAPFVVIGSR